jgi:hypothetical protein
MAILWKPTGTLDISTMPTDLPEQSGNGAIISGAMVRCKNLVLNRMGLAELRYGSSLISSFTPTTSPELILEAAGHRYIFAGNEIYYDEVLTLDSVICEDPVFSPVGGGYSSEQTVTITSSTASAYIYYTLDESTPDAQSSKYATPILVPASSYLKAIAIHPKGALSDSSVTSEFYSLFAQNLLITETDSGSIITETDSSTITTEGP